uniref:Uncharacterized protein n=1 Tax=Sinocyclocheilus rhinocerous TaxID=307959 RepID=A0A673J8V6_9TELE
NQHVFKLIFGTGTKLTVNTGK